MEIVICQVIDIYSLVDIINVNRITFKVGD